jgi:hypothetical protein
MLVLIVCVQCSDTEYVMDEKVCKHWALAGAMHGFVSQWELNAMTKFPFGACYIPSLQHIKCCDSYDQYELGELIRDPTCCTNSATCCQPVTGEHYSVIMNDDNGSTIIRKNQLRYILPKLEDNPHPEYFDLPQAITGRDISIICVLSGCTLVMLVSLFVIIYKLNKKYQ